MAKIKRRIHAGSICEQEVFSVSDRTRNLKAAEPRPRFKDEAERARHRTGISRRHHARVVNATFSPGSLYSTLTMDNEHEVHTFEEARHIGTLFLRRLKRISPEAQIMLYMGRGKSTQRIHFHMLSNGLTAEQIRSKWKLGDVLRIETLREKNYYNGVDCGRDYTGLANYLFDHWTPEQGGQHYRATANVNQPEREEPRAVKRNYSAEKPPRAPKGYRYIGCTDNGAGYLCFRYVKQGEGESPPTARGGT